ncbi:acyltransferase family protein [Devosia beringensis]|uniref:acyltransferase family protein n=1 Tax=Devosia beringensis TaxID=2657486 RepID=UPI00186B9284|nr:acyltransferase [Devosia beringensis]
MRRFEALDAFRGLAALGIVAVHVDFTARPWWVPENAQLYLLVDFFFVLSGFVISHSYSRRIENTGDVGIFMWRRLGRVWPLHMVMLACLLMFEVLKVALTATGAPSIEPFTGFAAPNSITQNLLLLNSLGTTPGLSWNVPSWSISGELVAYLVFSGVIYFAVPVRLVSMVIVISCLAVLMNFSPRGMDATFDFGAIRCMAGFFAGCFAYSLYRARPAASDSNDFLWTIAELVTLVVVLSYLSIARTTWLSFAAPLVFSACVLVFSMDRGLVSKALQAPWFAFLGRISYSIYMVHFVLLAVVVQCTMVVARLAPAVSAWFPFKDDLFTLGLLLLVIAGSSVTYRFVELPGMAFFRQLERRSGRRQAESEDRPRTPY